MLYKVVFPFGEVSEMSLERAVAYLQFVEKHWKDKGPYKLEEVNPSDSWKNANKASGLNEYWKRPKYLDVPKADLYPYPAKTDKTEVPSWDEIFMRQAYNIATKSKDVRTKIGSILVKDNDVISSGFNGFARKVKDLPERYANRETKYDYICHSEFNAIVNCARKGISSLNSKLYTFGQPCSECMKTVIQGGIKEIVTHKQWPNLTYSEKWLKSFSIAKEMAIEAGIIIYQLDKVLGINGFLDGKTINV